MLRSLLIARAPNDAHGFRLRGTNVSRLEALSDAVFGFAITLLVVTLEVPRTAAELFQAMRGFVAFGACFALLYFVWHHHYRFFRRYGLSDGVTETLNAVLLFVVLFFVYPLRFTFGWLVGRVMGDPSTVTRPDGSVVPVFQGSEGATLMLVYSAGYFAVFLIFALLHVQAYRQRENLQLNELEVFDTLGNVRECLLNAGIATLSLLTVRIGGAEMAAWSGLVYWLVGPVMAANGYLAGRARNQLKTRLAAG